MNFQDNIESVYNKACELKDSARKSLNNVDIYFQAAKKFEEASNLCQDFCKSNSITTETKYSMKVFAEYYISEKNDCLFAYYYEKRDFNKVHRYVNANMQNLDKVISLIESVPSSFSRESKDYLKKFLPKWRYFRENSEIKRLAIEARRSFDQNDFVNALDYYRRMADSFKKLINKSKSLEPVYERIVKGNYVGMMANASSSLAGILYKKASIDGTFLIGSFPLDLSLKLLRYIYEAYLLANIAYKENPEWEQYYEGSQTCLKNIRLFLKQNQQYWKNIFIEFKNESDMLNIMESLNPKLFAKTRNQFGSVKDNKIVELWMIGSFWLFVFSAIVGIGFIFLTKFSIREIIPLLVIVEFVFLIIGAFILRTTGDLSEKNFISLLSLAIKHQLKIFTKFLQSNAE